MIPILYDKNETAFASNGLGRLGDCISCLVTEERNGEYELEMEYPISGVHFDDITNGRIIAATHDEVGDVQPFDIYRISEPINGIVTINAHHISYRLNEIVVKPFTASNCSAAIAGLKTNSVNTNPFTFWTDKSVSGDYAVSVPSTLRGCLCGEEGSLLDVYGAGEYDFDLFNVKLYTTRGQDTPVTISYGKNLVDYLDEYDDSESFNAVAPYWSGTVTNSATGENEDNVITISEGYVTNGNPVDSGRTVVVPLDMSDVFENAPTTAQLKTSATSFINASNAYRASRNVTIDFVQLWKTEEYKQYAPLQRVNLCDTVLVNVPMYNVYDLRIKVIKTVYNVLLDRYDEIELGDPRQTFADTLTSELSGQIKNATAEATKAVKIAGNNTQHFWFTSTGLDTGAHITEITRETFLNDPNNGGPNLLARSNGVAVRDGLTELATFSANGVELNQGGNNVASFGSTVRIGTASGARAVTTVDGLDIYNSSNQKKASYGSTQYIYGGSETYPWIKVDGSTIQIAQSANNHSDISNSGLEIYQGGESVANFGSTLRIGKTSCDDLEYPNSYLEIVKNSNQGSRLRFIGTNGSHHLGHIEAYNFVSGSSDDRSFIIMGPGNQTNSPKIELQYDMQNGTYALILDAGNSSKQIYMDNSGIIVNGTTFFANGVTIGGHSSAIGTVTVANSTSNHSLASGTSFVALNSATDAVLSLPPGSWIITGLVTFSSNSTGRRAVQFYAGSTAFAATQVVSPPVSGAATQLMTTLIVTTSAASTSVYLQAYQNSGSTLTAGTNLRAIRIA